MPEARHVITSLSVVIPAYNAGAFIESTLRDVRGWLDANVPDSEIIVVNDASTDDTPGRVAGSPDGAVLLSNPRNRGKGFSVRHGMSRAAKSWRLFMDADNSTTISHLDRFARAVDDGRQSGSEPGVIIGSRRLGHSTIVRRQHPVRRMLGNSFPYLVRAVALPGISDSQCGFKLFSAPAAEAIFPRARVDRFAFDVELLLLARRLGVGIAEVPVDWDNPTTSTLRVRVDTARMFADVMTSAWRLRAGAPLPEPRTFKGSGTP